MDKWALAEMLDALDGTAYVTDLEGRLLCVGTQNWDSFASENAGQDLAGSPPLGRPVTEGISGETVRSLYQRVHQVAVSGERRIAFTFRCDAPDVERRMKMAIGPLRSGNAVVGVLYQSTILSERARPPLRFLEAAAALEQFNEDRAPIIANCSFCAKIDWPVGSDGPWVEPEVYYQRGGVSEVRISHGICPNCADDMADRVSYGRCSST
ncbi:MAG: hypothetical protein ACXWD3_10550 [Mycobacterium sp.]